MRKTIIFSLVLLLAIVFSFDSTAQRRGPKRGKGYGHSKSKKMSNYKGPKRSSRSYGGSGNREYWTVGVGINAMNYFGDLSPATGKLSTDITLTNPGIGVTASRVLYPGIFARFGFNIGNIRGNDFETKDPTSDASAIGRYSRNLQFKNTIKEFSLGFEFDLIPNQNGARGRRPFNPYVFLGVGVIHHAPKAIAPEFDQAGNPTGQGGVLVDLQSLGTEGQYIEGSGKTPYSKWQFAVPLGVGLKVRLPANFDLNFEFGFRKLFTDYLDDVSDGYVNLDDFGDNYLARALSERGAEPTNLMSDGAARDESIFGAVNYGPYKVGSGYNPTGLGGTRGGPDVNDFYVITQLRLVYIFDSKGASRGKFR